MLTYAHSPKGTNTTDISVLTELYVMTSTMADNVDLRDMILMSR